MGYKSTRAFPDLRRHLSTLCGSITWYRACEAVETGRRSPTRKEKSRWVLHGRKHLSCCHYQPTDDRGKDFNPGLSSLKGWAGSEPHRAAQRGSWSHPRVCPHEGSPLGAEPYQPGIGGVVCGFGGPAGSAASTVVRGGAGSPLG